MPGGQRGQPCPSLSAWLVPVATIFETVASQSRVNRVLNEILSIALVLALSAAYEFLEWKTTFVLDRKMRTFFSAGKVTRGTRRRIWPWNSAVQSAPRDSMACCA